MGILEDNTGKEYGKIREDVLGKRNMKGMEMYWEECTGEEEYEGYGNVPGRVYWGGGI